MKRVTYRKEGFLSMKNRRIFPTAIVVAADLPRYEINDYRFL